jgi:multisubunit Na+/H+ antiporter MnhF subunit
MARPSLGDRAIGLDLLLVVAMSALICVLRASRS